MNVCSGSFRSEKSGILFLAHCIAHTKKFKWAPVVSLSSSRRSSIPFGSNFTPCLNIILPHHRTWVENMVRFPGWRWRFRSLHNLKNFLMVSRSPYASSSNMRISSNHFIIYFRTSSVTIIWSDDCIFVTSFVVPWITRVGEKIPSGVMKDCEDI